MKRLVKGFALLSLGFVLGTTVPARGDVITYVLPDIGDFDGYLNYDTTATYTGSGFVGMYPDFPAFAHLMGLEYYSGVFSQTALQVDISALIGKTVLSARADLGAIR